ncbi:MAG: hypothetical protein NUV98_00145 [Candidatus Roizmanbacteria bacterium]|nr:hypothetical protein [Candidatus Roizmanbacteria bacterium]
MFKRILLSLGVLTVTVSAVVVGTQALLTDSVTLGVNTVSTGSVDLQIWDGATYVDVPVAGFDETLLPGQSSTTPFVVWLNNASTVALSIVGTATVTVETEGVYDSDDVTVTITPYDDGGTVAETPVVWTLTDWELGKAILPNIPAGTDQRYHVTVSVADTVEASNADVSFNMVFTGTQVNP